MASFAKPRYTLEEYLFWKRKADHKSEKFAHYRRLDSLSDYLLVSQTRMRAWSIIGDKDSNGC